MLEALRLLDGLQSFAEHGVMCPVIWISDVDGAGDFQDIDIDRKHENNQDVKSESEVQ